MFVRILYNSFKRPYLIHRFRSITDLGYSATMLAKSNVLIGIYSIKIIILLLLYRAVISFFFFVGSCISLAYGVNFKKSLTTPGILLSIKDFF